MSRLPQLYAWLTLLTSALPHLSTAEVRGVAWFSFGMVLAESCSTSAVALQLADLLGQKFDTVKRRLREWYCEAEAKAGKNRRQLDVRVVVPFEVFPLGFTGQGGQTVPLPAGAQT